MKLQRITLVLAAILLGAIVTFDALAGRGGGRSGGHGGSRAGSYSGHSGGHVGRFAGGGHFGPRFRTSVFIGAPLIAPLYYSYPPPYFNYPAPNVAPSVPAYIEQYPGQIDPQPSSYWYYCQSSNAYYPYVKLCPEGWQPVATQPPS